MCNIQSAVEKFENKLNLPKDFYNNLLNEDDWSFVIKMSALFEAACTHGLLVKLQSPEIESALKSIEHAHQKHGKILLITKLGVIVESQKTFLTELAELRNKLAHKIENVNFSFESYLSEMDENQKKKFVTVYGHGIHEVVEINGVSRTRKDIVLSDPKLSIWITAQEILACIYEDILGTEEKIKIKELLLSRVFPLLVQSSDSIKIEEIKQLLR
jgi:hypothetical protein